MNFPRNTPIGPTIIHSDSKKEFLKWWEQNKPAGISYAEEFLRNFAYSAWQKGVQYERARDQTSK